MQEDGEVKAVKLRYFDTWPCILKSGLLFVASGFGNHHVYWLDKLGDEEGVKFGR